MSSNQTRIKVTRAEAKVCDMMDGNRRCQIKFLLFSLANVSAFLTMFHSCFGWNWRLALPDWCHLNLKQKSQLLICSQCAQIAPQKRLSVHFKSFQSWEVLTFLYVNFNIISRSFITINITTHDVKSFPVHGFYIVIEGVDATQSIAFGVRQPALSAVFIQLPLSSAIHSMGKTLRRFFSSKRKTKGKQGENRLTHISCAPRVRNMKSSFIAI